MPDQPREVHDHQSLAKYPEAPTKLFTQDGITWRVPAQRDRDEAVPVIVEDLVQARAAVHQLLLLVKNGAGRDVDIQIMGHVLQGTTSEPPPQTRAEVIEYLDGLRDRLNGSLPYW